MFPTRPWRSAVPSACQSAWRRSGSRSRSGRSGSGRRRRRIAAGWATRTSRGTWRSWSGRPTSSIPTATSTACSTRRTPAAPTSRASTSPPYIAQMRDAAAPARRGPPPRHTPELDLRTRPRRRSARAVLRPQRGDARLGTRAEAACLPRPGLVLTTVCLKRVRRRLPDPRLPGRAEPARGRVLPGAQSSTGARAGGIFRVSFQSSSSLQSFDHIDPALAYTRESWALLDTVCAQLMRYRDQPPPQGYQLVPESPAASAGLSRRGRPTRSSSNSGFRFSDGRPVRADAFAHAIYRTLAHRTSTLPPYLYTQRHRRRRRRSRRQAHPTASGVRRASYTLVVRLPAAGDFAAGHRRCRSSAPSHRPCRRARKASAAFPGSRPLRRPSSTYRPDDRIMIRRNRYYRGDRVHHVDGFDVDLSSRSRQRMCSTGSKRARPTGVTTPPQPAFFEPGRA